MSNVTVDTVREYFDAEIGRGRRLLPDRNTVGGLGTWRKYERAATLMSDPAVRDVLDVGCNRGSIEALFHSLHPEKARRTLVEGVDVSGDAVAQARALALPNCTFSAYAGRELPFGSASFDLVVMVEVLEHVIEKEALLREVHRVLRPGGRLFLTTPNPQCVALRVERAIWGSLRWLFGRASPAKDLFIAQRALAASLETAGFRSPVSPTYMWPHAFIGVSNWGLVPPLPPALLYRYQKACLVRLERDSLPGWLQRYLMWTIVAEPRRQ
ncbi:MAG TPA: class I SAM-dependent methyltransferase [Gemmatimonadaceae bacterium]|jgi:Methylase involved in ubiquinone/menaquinone biosynthesis